MSDLRWLWAEERAKCGDYRQLGKLIIEDAYISKRGRELIKGFLDNPKKRRGAPRTFPQKWRDMGIASDYRTLRDDNVCAVDAREILAEKHGIGADAIKKIVTREKIG